MRTDLRTYLPDFREPWKAALMLLTLIPLFPEYVSFIFVLVAGGFAIRELRQHKQKLELGFIGKMILAYCGYMAITLIYSRNRISTLETLAMWLVLFAVYLIVFNILTDPDRLDFLLFYITAVAGTVGLIACIQYRFGLLTNTNPIKFWFFIDKYVYKWLPLGITETKYILRSCSTFSNPNVLAEYLMMSAPFVVCFNYCEQRKELHAFSRICLLLTFGGVMFSFSRGGYIAALILLAALIVLNFRHKFSAIALYTFAALMLVPDEVFERLFSINKGAKAGKTIVESVIGQTSIDYTTTSEIINNNPSDSAISTRWRIWLESLRAFLERPIFGYGAGVQTSGDILREQNLQVIHTHNIITQLLIEGGIIALLIFAIIGIVTVKRGVVLMKSGYSTAMWSGIAVLGFATSFTVQGMVDYPLMTPKLICTFLLILGIADRLVRFHDHPDEPALVRKMRRKLPFLRERVKE